MHWIDWSIIGAYGVGMLALGGYFARRQTTTEEYYVGRRTMGSFIIGISLFATLLSTISYLAYPGEMISKGPVILAGLLGVPIAYILVGYLLIPALMKRRVTSAYEVLEERLGPGPRLMAAMMFLMLRLMWMGLLVNVAAKAVVVMLGLDPSMVPWIVLICCVIAVAYTTMGGLRAVVITDVVQFFLLLGGALLTVALVSVKMGGFGWFPTSWSPHWDIQPLFSLDPYIRVTIVGAIVVNTLWYICTYGSDQMAIQRFMATGNAKAARRSLLSSNLSMLLLFAKYRAWLHSPNVCAAFSRTLTACASAWGRPNLATSVSTLLVKLTTSSGATLSCIHSSKAIRLGNSSSVSWADRLASLNICWFRNPASPIIPSAQRSRICSCSASSISPNR